MSWDDFSQNLSSFFASTSAAEWIAIVTALLYVVLATRESSWCWPFGIISSGIYVWLNFDRALYNDAWLSAYYCLVGVYGWYAWVAGRTHKRGGAELHRGSLRALAVCAGAGALLGALLGWITGTYTDSQQPYLDGTLTAFSFVATWMTARKILENWIFWIVIDAAYIALYFRAGLPATGVLFFIYTVIAVYGYFKWRQKLNPSAA